MFIDKENLFHVDFTVPTYSCDAYYCSLPRFYFQIVQETAGLHAFYRHVSLPELNANGKTWVIVRNIMSVKQYLYWRENIHVITGVPNARSFFGPRLVYGTDKNNNEVFSAKSTWAVLDLKTRSPLRMGEITDLLVPTTSTDEKFRSLNDKDVKINSGTFKASVEMATYYPQISSYDTDINKHINNVVYFDWFMNALPESFYLSYVPSYIDICFSHEVHSSDNVEVKVYILEKNNLECKLGFILFNLSKNVEACVSEITFIPRCN